MARQLPVPTTAIWPTARSRAGRSPVKCEAVICQRRRDELVTARCHNRRSTDGHRLPSHCSSYDIAINSSSARETASTRRCKR